MHLDLHQHIWTAPLIEALAARNELPFAGCTATWRSCTLRASGRRRSTCSPRTRTGGRGCSTMRIDLAVIALSSPIGIEALPRDEARRLIDAHLDGVTRSGTGSRRGDRWRSTSPSPTTSTRCSRADASASRCPRARSPRRARSRGGPRPRANRRPRRAAVRAPRPGPRRSTHAKRRPRTNRPGGRR